MDKKNLIIIIIVAALVALATYYFLPGGADKVVESASNDQQEESNMVQDDYQGKTAFLKTNKGDITLEFYADDAPKTVENFIRLAESGYYNGVIFHRVVKDFVIQAGDPTGTGAGGESIFGVTFNDELNPEADSYKQGYKKGVLAMANRGPNTNGSQFFIMLKDNPLPHLYTIFGKVTNGQDVVDEIGLVLVDQNDKPLEDVVIESVTIK